MSIIAKGARALAIVAAVSGAAACATTTKVAVRQPGDLAMTCAQLNNEFAKLDRVQQEADNNKGVNTANVAAVLLFWPAAVGNYMDADKAEKLMNQRRDHLMDIHGQKGCATQTASR